MVISMTILIDNRSGLPIYEQIVTQIREQILSGELGPDAALPSIRSLAKDLRISVITTKRAYEELEREGLLYTVPGKGAFASPGDAATEARREELLGQLGEVLSELRVLGMGADELDAVVKQAFEGGKGND